MNKDLSTEEIAILVELMKGLSNNDIAQKLYMSVGTLKSRLSEIFRKLNAHNRVEAAIKGLFILIQYENNVQNVKNLDFSQCDFIKPFLEDDME